jgi:putative lipase involved disintegration of autophagic bodies
VFTPSTPAGWQITGHSLGGGLAAAASVVSGFYAMTFNAAGVNYVTVQQFDTRYGLNLNINSQAQLQSAYSGLGKLDHDFRSDFG